MCSAAPVMEFSSGDPELQEFFRKNREFAFKIKNDVARMKGILRNIIKVAGEDQLQLIKEQLGIEQVNLLQCHNNPYDLEACFNQILAGLHTYRGYLTHMSQTLTTQASQLNLIKHDVSNLSDNIQQEMKDCGLTTVTYPPEENQTTPAFLQNPLIGSYLILANFQRFLETTLRALRPWSA
ncbi:myelomonocytic growth factor-like [Hemicordylus capensis]|uniref:myelomonocytic growth factor-like n=1 Tax=Hemicordylus capensis TaxID=884348 RepID=UPI0023029A12|nr:myelomonocytic growth factor-like [Hemicordylus capensis]